MFSPVYCPDGLNTTVLSQGCLREIAPTLGSGQNAPPTDEEIEESPFSKFPGDTFITGLEITHCKSQTFVAKPDLLHTAAALSAADPAVTLSAIR